MACESPCLLSVYTSARQGYRQLLWQCFQLQAILLRVSEVLGFLTIFINVALSRPQIRASDNTKDRIYEHNTHLNCLQFFLEFLYNPHPWFNFLPHFGGGGDLIGK